MKILLLASQHGNELLGEKLYAYIQSAHRGLVPHIDCRIANPKAHAANVRYIESDMNRSYDPSLTTYEAKQAARIERLIAMCRYNLVLDLHATRCIQPPCCIVEDITGSNRDFLRASTIDKIVLMQHQIVRTSLIGNVGQAVSIEVSNGDVNDDLLEALCQDLRRYLMAARGSRSKSVYVVTDLLAKASITPRNARALVNFQQSPNGFIPILVGNNSYKKQTDYLGFKASTETIIRL